VKILLAAVNDDGSGNGMIYHQQQSNGSNQSSNEKATQDYRLFSQGKKLVEVAIRLGLSEKEVTRFYTEYWKLRPYTDYIISTKNQREIFLIF
jgi:hypothetical protein